MATEDSSDDEAAPLMLIAAIHQLLAAILIFVLLLSIPLLLGLLIGVSLIGAPGTGTPAAARGPVLDYIRRTGPFPASGPLVQVVGIIRTALVAGLLASTAVGLRERLRLAWYTVVVLYGFVLVTSWPNWFGMLVGAVGLLVAWAGRQYLQRERSLSWEWSRWWAAIGEEWEELGEGIDTD